MVQSYDARQRYGEGQPRRDDAAGGRDFAEDKDHSRTQQPNATGGANGRDPAANSSQSFNLNGSNLSNIQKELRPNKIVNKGNSVFSNHHKMIHNGKTMPVKAMQNKDGSFQSASGIQKLNVH